MRTKIKFPFYLAFIAAALQLIGCSDKPVNLSVARELVKEYYESGKFDKELNEVISRAKDEFSAVEFTEKSVVIFDVDETALNNYGLAELMGFGYVYEMNKKWNRELKAPAIPQVKELYEYLIAKGSKVIFLTGRNIPEYEVTYKNLKREGYAVFDTLITRRENEYKLTATEFKSSKRVELIEMGYEIIGTVGDQWSDLEGAHYGIQVKIPNYLYQIAF
ncbi:MAG: HAD family acid phosphatase [Bacteroidetes bacterium]|nr:HAD family acid phosphatase [Bacteroidota bacterium]MCH7771005.1 HAD family acid phosphatase [Bacteroidota bacterium]